jgi:hypothetical protein
MSQGSPEINHLSHGQVNISAGSSLQQSSGDLRRPIFGQDDTMDAKKGGCSHERAKIALVRDMVRGKEQAEAPGLQSAKDDLLKIHVGEESSESRHTLVGGARAEAI